MHPQPAMQTSLPSITPVDRTVADIPARPTVRLADLELPAARLDLKRAAAIYREHGALVVRGLFTRYMAEVRADIERTARRALDLLPQAEQVHEGWTTPDGTLFLPAPQGYARDRQIMVLGCGYRSSGAMFRSALDDTMCDLAAALVGPDVELFMDGQVLYKEPVGGHPKHLHQDSAYFEHRFDGPMAVLNYVVDTFSHLGLDGTAWPWERSVPICGQAGDAIIFHVHTIHGSQVNRSAASRPVCIHRYRNAQDYVVVGATSTQKRKDAESAEARAAAGRSRWQQRGMMVRGFRPFTG